MLNYKTLSLLLEDTRHTVRHPKKAGYRGLGTKRPTYCHWQALFVGQVSLANQDASVLGHG